MGYLLGFRTGTLVRVISEAHSVRTKPEVNLGGYGASHDPVGGVYTCFLFNLAPKMGYLLWEIDRYHSDVTVQNNCANLCSRGHGKDFVLVLH